MSYHNEMTFLSFIEEYKVQFTIRSIILGSKPYFTMKITKLTSRISHIMQNNDKNASNVSSKGGKNI